MEANMNDYFSRVATKITVLVGSWQATILAFFVVVIWTFGGFIVGFTDTCQLIINTGTTIVTFLMVFAIQNAANRDGIWNMHCITSGKPYGSPTERTGHFRCLAASLVLMPII